MIMTGLWQNNMVVKCEWDKILAVKATLTAYTDKQILIFTLLNKLSITVFFCCFKWAISVFSNRRWFSKSGRSWDITNLSNLLRKSSFVIEKSMHVQNSSGRCDDFNESKYLMSVLVTKNSLKIQDIIRRSRTTYLVKILSDVLE